jgi:hypothetical protein
MTDLALDTSTENDVQKTTEKSPRTYRSRKITPKTSPTEINTGKNGSRTRTSVGNININDKTSVFVENPQEKNKIGIYIKKVTPQYAAKLLQSNHVDQRSLKEYAIDSYVRAMKSGLWSAGTGEAVKFSDKGDLIDGQNRLTAVARSGCTVYMMFMTGILEANIKCIDNGISRNLGDVLRITQNTKYKINTNSLAAFIRHFHYQKIMATEKISESSVRHKYRLCSVQAVNLFQKMPHLDESLSRFTQLFGNKITKRIPQSVAMLMFYLFDSINKDITFSILKTLEGGVPFDGKGADSPSWAICQWITERKMTGIRFETNDYINAFIWAFDSMMNGKEGISYKPSNIYYIGKAHAGCDQIQEVFDRIKY